MMSMKRRRQFFELIKAASNTPTVVLEDQLATFCTQQEVLHRSIGLGIPNNNRIILKCEHLSAYSPTGSLYDRLYPWLFLHAEQNGHIDPGGTDVIECSVGNAAAAFAHVARELGYKNYSAILPTDIYGARVDQVSNSLGANVIFSPERIGPLGYIKCLENILAENIRNIRFKKATRRLYPISKIRKIPVSPYAMFVNEAKSVLSLLGHDTHIDAFVFGIGAGNTVSKVGYCIKSQVPSGRVVVCEHSENPFAKLLLSGKHPPVGTPWSEPDFPATTIHGVPLSKLNLDLSVIDEVILTTRQQRDETWEIINRELCLQAGRPSGMVLCAALKTAERLVNSNILMPIFDSVAKYAPEVWEPVYDLSLESLKKPSQSIRQVV